MTIFKNKNYFESIFSTVNLSAFSIVERRNLILKKILFFLALYLNISSVCFAEEIDVFKLVENGTPEQLQSALKQGAKFNIERNMSDFEEDSFEAPDYWPFDTGETPLHRAAAYNHNPESIKFLIKQGLDVNAIAEVGLYSSLNPLACALFSKNTVAVKELLEAGANPNAWVAGGYNFIGTPFHIIAFDYDDASLARKIICELVNAGGNINSHEELSPEEIRDLRESSSEFGKNNTIFLPRNQWVNDDPFYNMTDFFSHYAMGTFLTTFTPIMWAVLYDKPEIVDIFLDFNADVNLRSIENKSAVDYANDLPHDSKIKKSSSFERLQSNTVRKK